jgi:hypothetical protein
MQGSHKYLKMPFENLKFFLILLLNILGWAGRSQFGLGRQRPSMHGSFFFFFLGSGWTRPSHLGRTQPGRDGLTGGPTNLAIFLGWAGSDPAFQPSGLDRNRFNPICIWWQKPAVEGCGLFHILHVDKKGGKEKKELTWHRGYGCRH